VQIAITWIRQNYRNGTALSSQTTTRSSATLFGQETCEVVAEAENGQAAIDAGEALHPDVVFLDISMPVLDGFQAAVQFRRNLPSIRIIIVTSYSHKAYVEQAFLCGAQAYVVKGSAVFQVPDAIRAVMEGRTFPAGY
jgi:DNA-binding NarL/FixJ family response regulator